MKVAFYLDGDVLLEVDHFEEASALDLQEDLEGGESRFLSIAVDNDQGKVLLARERIIRVDFDWPD